MPSRDAVNAKWLAEQLTTSRRSLPVLGKTSLDIWHLMFVALLPDHLLTLEGFKATTHRCADGIPTSQ